MIDLIRSSDIASHAFAGKVAREASKHNFSLMQKLDAAIEPVWIEIAKRGKLPRNRLRPAFESIITGLTGNTNIVDISLSTICPSRLSVHEMHRAQMIVAISMPSKKERFDFISYELTLQRDLIEVRMDIVNFSATDHVLARFIRRGKDGDPLRAFFGDIVRPMRTAALLMPPSTYHRSGRLMLPHATGFLLATTTVQDDTDDDTRKMPCVVRFQSNGEKKIETVESTGRDGVRLMADAWSFVDEDDVGPIKQAVYDALLRWEKQHAAGIETYFRALTFGNAPVVRFDQWDMMTKQVEEAAAASKMLIESDIWHAFAAGKKDQ